MHPGIQPIGEPPERKTHIMGKMKATYALWDLAKKDGEIALKCKKCRHESTIKAKDLISRTNIKILGLIPFRCSVCGCTDIERRPLLPAVF